MCAAPSLRTRAGGAGAILDEQGPARRGGRQGCIAGSRRELAARVVPARRPACSASAGWPTSAARPSARMVALVATLAALAALGRDAFVALPDVKPITAMALVVGYALGPLAGLHRRRARDARLEHRCSGRAPTRPGRWRPGGWSDSPAPRSGGSAGAGSAACGLALACALAALAAKEVMNVYTWTIGAIHTPAAFLAVAGAGASLRRHRHGRELLFGLAFGPELARLLARVAGAHGGELGGAGTPGAASTPAAARISRPPQAGLRSLAPRAAWSRRSWPERSCANGGRAAASTSRMRAWTSRARSPTWPAPRTPTAASAAARGQSSSELYSAWAAIGLAAAGRDPPSLRAADARCSTRCAREAGSLQGAGDVERTILALHAVRRVGALARRAAIRSRGCCAARPRRLVRRTGQPDRVRHLRAAGRRLRAGELGGIAQRRRLARRQQDARRRLRLRPARRQQRRRRHGRGRCRRSSMRAHGQRAAVARAVAYLARAQNPDGGFPQEPGGESNAQSTAWAVQGLVAAGATPGRSRAEAAARRSATWRAWSRRDGSVRYSRTGAQTPVWVTAQALDRARRASPSRSRRSRRDRADRWRGGSALRHRLVRAPTQTGARPRPRVPAVGLPPRRRAQEATPQRARSVSTPSRTWPVSSSV